MSETPERLVDVTQVLVHRTADYATAAILLMHCTPEELLVYVETPEPGERLTPVEVCYLAILRVCRLRGIDPGEVWTLLRYRNEWVYVD